MKKVYYLDPDERKWTMEDLGLHWNAIGDVVMERERIEGIFFASGRKIIERLDMSNHCSVCLDALRYNDEFDSVYCEACNEWRELACADPLCEYCLARPEKPSDCK